MRKAQKTCGTEVLPTGTVTRRLCRLYYKSPSDETTLNSKPLYIIIMQKISRTHDKDLAVHVSPVDYGNTKLKKKKKKNYKSVLSSALIIERQLLFPAGMSKEYCYC